PETVFSMAGVGYWAPGSHAHWVADRPPIKFPIHARLLLKNYVGVHTHANIVYEVDKNAMEQYASLGGQIDYVESSHFSKRLSTADEVIDISP
ncbi:MAG: hypothetical protein AAB889_04155, partial [Patescibacteria group bacterium]